MELVSNAPNLNEHRIMDPNVELTLVHRDRSCLLMVLAKNVQLLRNLKTMLLTVLLISVVVLEIGVIGKMVHVVT